MTNSSGFTISLSRRPSRLLWIKFARAATLLGRLVAIGPSRIRRRDRLRFSRRPPASATGPASGNCAVDTERPGIAVCLDHLRLAGEILLPILDVTLAELWLKVRGELN